MNRDPNHHLYFYASRHSDSELSQDRKAKLDRLARLGATLGIFDAQLLLDIEQAAQLPPPFPDPKESQSESKT